MSDTPSEHRGSEQLISVYLHRTVGGETAPDLRLRILTAWAAESGDVNPLNSLRGEKDTTMNGKTETRKHLFRLGGGVLETLIAATVVFCAAIALVVTVPIADDANNGVVHGDNGPSTDQTDDDPDGGTNTDPQRDPAADAETVVAGMDQFADAMFGALVADPTRTNQNVWWSPASVARAISIAQIGARGVTRDEMRQLLHLPDDISDEALAEAWTHVIATAAATEGPEREQVKLVNADSLWTSPDFTLQPGLATLLTDRFDAQWMTTDFEDAYGSADRINAWIAEQTGDRIRQAVDGASIDPLTKFVLVNAMDLGALWPEEFDSTGRRDFHLLDGTTTDAMLMRCSADKYALATGDGWELMRLPLRHSTLEVVIVLPDLGRFTEVQRALTTADLNAALERAELVEVTARVPKFSTESQFDMTDLLKELGMRAAFDPARADFFPMRVGDVEMPLHLAEVRQVANLEVNEKGVRASAATVMRGRLGMDDDRVFTVDRPFLIRIRDTATGATLFMGRILDPTQ